MQGFNMGPPTIDQYENDPAMQPPSAENEKRIAAVAKALGVEPTDIPAIRSAFESLMAPVEEGEAKALALMTASEIETCREVGASPIRYVLNRAYRQGKR